MDNNPVCGYDQMTYGNACLANCANQGPDYNSPCIYNYYCGNESECNVLFPPANQAVAAWCRQTSNPAMSTCTPYQNRGDSCGASLPPQFEQRCAPGLTCSTPSMPGASGQCM